MAMVTCPGCGGEVADSYSDCPECGHALPLPTAMDPDDSSMGESASASPAESMDDGVARGLAEGRLWTCPDCSTTVSHRLSACHRCGCPFDGASRVADRSSEGYDWGRAFRGLRLYRLGMIAYVGSMLIGFLFVVMATGYGSADLTVTLTLVAGLALITSHVLMLLGLHGFTSIPGESSAGGLAWAAFGGSLAATVVTSISVLFALAGIMTTALPYFGVVGSIAWVVGSICFILALAGVAKYVGAPDLSGQAMVVLVLLIGTIGLNIASDVVSGMIRRAAASDAWSMDKMNEMKGVVIFLLIGLAIMGVIYLVKFLQLLATLTAILGEDAIEEEDLEDEDVTF